MKPALLVCLCLLLFSPPARPENPSQSGTIRVYVAGAIQKTGKYDVPSAMAFIAAITEAGGPGNLADLQKVKILRPTVSENKTVTMKLAMTVDYKLIIDGKASMPVMENGDVIFIPVRVDAGQTRAQ